MTTASGSREMNIASKESGTAGLISLVVATIERTTELEPLLRSLLAQTNPNYELIVADQNKDDRLAPMLEPLKSAGIAVRHLRLAQPGASAARNFGLAHAKGEFVAFPDDDCWYEPDVLERARDYFRTRPDVDGIVGHWVELDPKHQRPMESLSWSAWRQYKGRAVACITLFFRVERLQAVGGFSENFGPEQFFGSSEEEDLILRMLAAGFRLDYVPSIDIHHFHSNIPELSARQCRRCRSYGRGMGAVLAKHRLPMWVIGRGLVGPWYHALRSENPASALLLAALAVWGRIEGLTGWWLWGRRQSEGQLTSKMR